MGGVYGKIDSRDDFFRTLGEARAIAQRLLDLQPKNVVIARVDAQLDAMQRLGDDGREPTKAERETIQIGLIAVRELDAERDDDSGDLAKLLFGLQNYVDDWPTDAAAERSTDADYWKKFGL
jgi:hypothetical protein